MYNINSGGKNYGKPRVPKGSAKKRLIPCQFRGPGRGQLRLAAVDLLQGKDPLVLCPWPAWD